MAYSKDTTIDETSLKSALLDILYPVGAIYITISENDFTNFLGGKWVKLSEGYTLWTANSNAGNTISAGLPNIKGTFSLDPTGTSSIKVAGIEGAFSYVNIGNIYVSESYAIVNDKYGVIFDANRGAIQSGIYRDDCTTVQPPAYKVYAWKRIS